MTPVFPAKVSSAGAGASAPRNVGALRDLEARNDNSAAESHIAAVPLEGTVFADIAVDSQAMGLASELLGDPLCPNRFYAAPNHVPNARPNVAAHLTATHGSMQEAGGNNVQGAAE